MLRIGCAGFPVARDRYWRTLDFVEARTGEAMPRAATLADWRSDAPEGAEFAVQAYRLVTHSKDDRGFPPAGKRLTPTRQLHCGGFRDSLEVHEAWLATKAAAELLRARAVIFETPASFQPGPDRLRDMYRFFKTVPRGKAAFVWHPRGPGWGSMGEKVCADLGLIRAFDPLAERPPRSGAFLYLRPTGPRSGVLSVDKLSTIRSAAEGRPAYVALTHRDSFRDAARLVEDSRIS